jgi:hypothetical protein
MRADPAVLDRCAGTPGIDIYSREFVREARGLVLACGAALTATLAVHRPGKNAYDHDMCGACGTWYCPTLRPISHALAAYAIRPVAVDRAEAWRLAEAGFGPAVEALRIEEAEDCFIARPTPSPRDGHVLVVDRRTGALTRWSDMPTDQLIDHYRAHKRGEP